MKIMAKSTVVGFGKNLVGIWVNFGRYLVLRINRLQKAVFGLFRRIFTVFATGL
jgi:hypothetical protein